MTQTGPMQSGGPTQPPPERVVARVRRHARVLTVPVLVLLVVCGAVGFAVGNVPETWMEFALVGLGMIVVFVFTVLPYLAWLTRRYTITTRRLILRGGLFVAVRQELLHSRGYDVTVRRNWFQSIFGSGDVRINTGHDKPVVLADVPNPNLVQRVLHDLQEQSNTLVAERRRWEQSAAPDEPVAWGGR
ncbi:PH domain-containing protein [Agromyces sp. SYSU T00194]|uniref:PH domain-containing protein n=1 Tax=Agromyces chitinivorans TaxID=3158560 RepID=UPI00339621B8